MFLSFHFLKYNGGKMYILVKVLGVDHVKTRLCNTKDEALKEAIRDIKAITDDGFNISDNTLTRRNGKIYITVNKANNPFDYIEYVISKAKMQEEY